MMARSKFVFNLPKRTGFLVFVILFLCFSFHCHLLSLQTPVFLTEPLTQAVSQLSSTEWGDSIPRFIGNLSEAEPPTLSRPAACEGLTQLGINQVEKDTQRRDVTPVAKSQIRCAAEAHEQVVQMIKMSPDLVHYTPHTKGIVTVGGGRYTGTLLVSLRMLRRTNSTLPVEVFMPNQEDYDNHTCEVILPSLNAKCVLIPEYEGLTIERYQYKIFAVILSSFEDVLFLDADNFPLIDPAEFMTSKVYKQTGYVLWGDFWWSTTSPHYFNVINQPVPSLLDYGTTESGQMMISKRQHWDTLLLVLYYNIYGPAFYYPILTQCEEGDRDKETWLYAAIALGKRYYQVRQKVDIIGHFKTAKENGEEQTKYEGAGMMQHDPIEDWRITEKEKEVVPSYRITEGREVVFMHHNLVKLNPVDMVDWVERNKNGEGRIWGRKEDTVITFGKDLEAEVWDEVLFVGCEYGESLLVSWSKEVCERLKDHWAGVVEKEMGGAASLAFGGKGLKISLG